MRRQVVLLNIGGDVFGAPISERINLGLLSDLFKDWHVRALCCLVAFAACYTRLITLNNTIERTDFAKIAATIRRRFIQLAIRVLCFNGLRVRAYILEIGETQIIYYHITVSERFSKVLSRIKENDRHVFVNLRNHMQKHDRVYAER